MPAATGLTTIVRVNRHLRDRGNGAAELPFAAHRLCDETGGMGAMRARWRFSGGWGLFGAAALGLTAMCLALLAAYGAGEAGVRVVIRATARTSLVLFLGAFTASSLRRLWPSPATRWLRRNRRYLGVSFAYSHLLHLLAIVALLRVADSPPQIGASTLVGGGIAYAFIAAMTATSFDRTARWLGPLAWRRLHLAGGYYIWLIFSLSYLPRALQSTAYAPLAALLLAALALRVLARLQARQPLGVAA